MVIRRPHLTLGTPVVVSQGPPDLKDWGPWQFPAIERLADGRLHVSFHIAADSAKAYGLPVGHAVSADNGSTWQALPDIPPGSGIPCANGDRLRSIAMRSLPLSDLAMPEPVAAVKHSYGLTFVLYNVADLPHDLQAGWRFARFSAATGEYTEETAHMNIPNEIRFAAEGVLAFPWMWRMRVAPDGSLWGLMYGFAPAKERGAIKGHSQFLHSIDNGHTWTVQSEIAYQGDPAADPRWDIWDGFAEPNIGFLPDGSMMCLLRTTDGHGIGPLYSAYSYDQAKTWTTPRVFDDRGVWPAIVELKNGVTLASYGRTGLFVRASSDPSGHVWADKVAVVEPLAYQTDTCSYSDMIVLDDHSALIAYSNFTWPNADGAPCKTIMVRTISVVP
jgi:hypothetical protein